MNSTSSRSHILFSLTITRTHTLHETEHTTSSRFTLVDLAGSEDQRTAQTGDCFSPENVRERSSERSSSYQLQSVSAEQR